MEFDKYLPHMTLWASQFHKKWEYFSLATSQHLLYMSKRVKTISPKKKPVPSFIGIFWKYWIPPTITASWGKIWYAQHPWAPPSPDLMVDLNSSTVLHRLWKNNAVWARFPVLNAPRFFLLGWFSYMRDFTHDNLFYFYTLPHWKPEI